MGKLGYLDNLVLNGFEKVVQYAAKHDLSKYDLMKRTGHLRDAGWGTFIVTTTLNGAIDPKYTLNQKLIAGGVALAASIWVYKNLNNQNKKTSEKEIKEYQKYLEKNTPLKDQSTIVDTRASTKGDEERFLFGVVGNLALYGTAAYLANKFVTDLNALQLASANILIFTMFTRWLAEDYLPDTSFLVSPKKQAQLEAKL